jgi:hypothetical protein
MGRKVRIESDDDHSQAAETAAHKTAPPHTTQSPPTLCASVTSAQAHAAQVTAELTPAAGSSHHRSLRHRRCRSAAVIARSPSGGRPRFFVTFFVTGGSVTRSTNARFAPQRSQRSNIFQHLQKKSGRDFKVRGPRAEAHDPYGAPPPGSAGESVLMPAPRYARV